MNRIGHNRGMNTDIFQEKWVEIKEKIESKWSKFSKAEIESVRDNFEELVSILQKVYGQGRVQAERECHDFQLSLRPLLQPAIRCPVRVRR